MLGILRGLHYLLSTFRTQFLMDIFTSVIDKKAKMFRRSNMMTYISLKCASEYWAPLLPWALILSANFLFLHHQIHAGVS